MNTFFKPFSVLSIILLISLSAQGQSKTENLEKYWKYRTDLVDEFLIVGSDKGMSLPAARLDTNGKNGRFIKWSDQTIYLGWYIGVLATEHYLLSNQDYEDYDRGKNDLLSKNTEELFYALNAVRRLDTSAERYFLPECNMVDTNWNGFFLRDDASFQFVDTYHNVDTFISSYVNGRPELTEMSQDQAYHLLLGLALVKQFIPESLNFQGENIRDLAINQATKILNWLSRSNWRVKNPACDNRNVYRGYNAYFFGKGIAEMAKFISEGNLNLDSLTGPNQEYFWNLFANLGNPSYERKDNMHMAMTIAAIGKGWGIGTFGNLMNLATRHDYYLYPLLAIALHGKDEFDNVDVYGETLKDKCEWMLNTAPPDGIYSVYPDSNKFGWNIGRRFTADIKIQHRGRYGHGGTKYNGIDYQLLHNLFFIAFPGKWDPSLNIEKLDNYSSLEVYPNPTTGYLHIDGMDDLQSEKLDLQLIDLKGRVLYDKNGSFHDKSISLDFSFLQSGIYILRIQGKNGSNSVRKIFIEP